MISGKLKDGNLYVIRGQEYITYVSAYCDDAWELYEVNECDELGNCSYGESLIVQHGNLHLVSAFSMLYRTPWTTSDLIPASMVSAEEFAISAYYDATAEELLQDVDFGDDPSLVLGVDDIDGF